MTRWSTDHETIEAEIGRIQSLGLDDLRMLWRTTLRAHQGSNLVPVNVGMVETARAAVFRQVDIPK